MPLHIDGISPQYLMQDAEVVFLNKFSQFSEAKITSQFNKSHIKLTMKYQFLTAFVNK